jgi:hypothetical protein
MRDAGGLAACGRGLLICFGSSRLRRSLPFEARLEGCDQVGRRGPRLDLNTLNLLTGDLLLDHLQEALAVLVLVVLRLELGRGQLANQALGERPLLVSDLRRGALVDRSIARAVGATRRTRGIAGSAALTAAANASSSRARPRLHR